MINKTKLKLSGKGISISGVREWFDDNLKIILQSEVFHEVIDVSNEDQELRIGWFVPGDLQITSDFTIHTESGMRGESFTDNPHQVLILDKHSKLSEFIAGDLLDVDISDTQNAFNKLIGSKFHIGNHYDDLRDKNDHGVILISKNPELILIQTDTNSIRISNKTIFVFDREEESLVLISEENGITVIKNGESLVEINDDIGICIDGMEFDPSSIINHIAESFSDAFSDFHQ